MSSDRSGDEGREEYAIQSEVWWRRHAMPLGSMVSYVLQDKPCECHAMCFCDRYEGVS